MQYRRLGKTELLVSEVGFGGEWLERHNYEECKAMIDRADELGINILDCWFGLCWQSEKVLLYFLREWLQ